MTNEQLRMQMLSGIITEGQYKAKLQENADKESLNESMIGGIVGIGAINQIPPRAKTDYEMAFEHFLGERQSRIENPNQDPRPMEEGEVNENMLAVGDNVRITAPLDVDAETDEGTIAKVYPNFDSIPSEDIGYYEVDADAYDESALNSPWYKVDQDGEEMLYAAEELELN